MARPIKCGMTSLIHSQTSTAVPSGNGWVISYYIYNWCNQLSAKTTSRSFALYVYESLHYIDVIMTTMASQITSLTVVYSTVYSDADQRKHQSSASLAFVWGIHRDRWIPRTKGQLRGNVSNWWRRHGLFLRETGHMFEDFCDVWRSMINLNEPRRGRFDLPYYLCRIRYP